MMTSSTTRSVTASGSAAGTRAGAGVGAASEPDGVSIISVMLALVGQVVHFVDKETNQPNSAGSRE